MKVLVLGSGAKDHAIAWWFSQSNLIEGLYIAPANVGTTKIAVNLSDVDPSSPEQVYKACVKYDIDFVFIGTEVPLLTGVVDFLNKKGIDTFGTPGFALKLENNRDFARKFMKKYKIPTSEYKTFSNIEELEKFLDKNPGKTFVGKKNNLSPSRMMIESSCKEELLEFSKEMLKTDKIILESYIKGLPITLSILLDNKGYLPLPYCSEYSKSEENDTGKATGGMGCICPIPISKELKEKIREQIVQPTLRGLASEHLSYKGVLTFSILIKDSDSIKSQPYLVDYHVRLNDPATQAFVPTIKTDLVKIMEEMKNDTISSSELEVNDQTTVSVVVASKGYPENPEIDKTLASISPIDKYNLDNSVPLLFFGAVKENNEIISTTGGRCVTVVGRGSNIINANSKVYKSINKIKFCGSWYRKDIGNKFFEET